MRTNLVQHRSPLTLFMTSDDPNTVVMSLSVAEFVHCRSLRLLDSNQLSVTISKLQHGYVRCPFSTEVRADECIP